MMLDAKEAKRQSEQNAIIRLQERRCQQRIAIENDIKEAIERGDTSISYPADIYDEIVNELHRAGYSITKNYYEYYHGSRYCHDTTISWEDAVEEEET